VCFPAKQLARLEKEATRERKTVQELIRDRMSAPSPPNKNV